jgi:hypothetical protein
MEQHFTRKTKDESQNFNDKMAYSINPLGQSRLQAQCDYQENTPQYKPSTYEQLAHSSSVPSIEQKAKTISSNQMNQMNSNYDNHGNYPKIPNQTHSFRDYFEERTNKFEDLAKKNFDGGQQFFKIQEAYNQKKQTETQNYADFLKKQLQ